LGVREEKCEPRNSIANGAKTAMSVQNENPGQRPEPFEKLAKEQVLRLSWWNRPWPDLQGCSPSALDLRFSPGNSRRLEQQRLTTLI
jgi:hypothetical protein